MEYLTFTQIENMVTECILEIFRKEELQDLINDGIWQHASKICRRHSIKIHEQITFIQKEIITRVETTSIQKNQKPAVVTCETQTETKKIQKKNVETQTETTKITHKKNTTEKKKILIKKKEQEPDRKQKEPPSSLQPPKKPKLTIKPNSPYRHIIEQFHIYLQRTDDLKYTKILNLWNSIENLEGFKQACDKEILTSIEHIIK